MWPFNSGGDSSLSNDDNAVAAADKCPVDEKTRSTWLKQNGKATETTTGSTSSAMAFLAGQQSQDGSTTTNLSRDRVVSSIPRHGVEASKDASSNWVYPSPAQFFAAMERKNHNPNAQDMNIVVPIHNAVNERAWQEILAWERYVCAESWQKCGGPQLVSFKGRPKDVTWRAWLRSFTGYQRPFDRHDWVIDRCGKRITYVIDFYTGKATAGKQSLSFYLDVRPSPASWQGVKTRFQRYFLRSSSQAAQQTEQ